MVTIKGKSYKTVAERLQELKADYKSYSINTEYTYYSERKMWVVKAGLTTENGTYTGLAQEIEANDYKSVNHTSALENAETSAIGRALAAAGYAGSEYASADEMQKAFNRRDANQMVKQQENDPTFRTWTKEDGELGYLLKIKNKVSFVDGNTYEILESKFHKGELTREDLAKLKWQDSKYKD